MIWRGFEEYYRERIDARVAEMSTSEDKASRPQRENRIEKEKGGLPKSTTIDEETRTLTEEGIKMKENKAKRCIRAKGIEKPSQEMEKGEKIEENKGGCKQASHTKLTIWTTKTIPETNKKKGHKKKTPVALGLPPTAITNTAGYGKSENPIPDSHGNQSIFCVFQLD